MIRPVRYRSLLALIASGACCSIACDYSGDQTIPSREIRTAPLPTSNVNPTNRPQNVATATNSTPVGADSTDQKEKREAILNNVLRLIQTAAITPGGRHFDIATKNLNEYFEQSIRPGELAIRPESRAYLASMLPVELIRGAEDPKFELRDARHIEDCMLYNEIANRVAGEGDDLTRVRRLFDWMVRHVQLVPEQWLAPTGMEQAQARPYDVLLRGMATETQGYWTERGWLFMALCRQIGVDVGLTIYTPRKASRILSVQPTEPTETQPVAWICVALIGDKAYLFDQRLGIAIPDASGTGVATLEEALQDPKILRRIDLPGQTDYGTTREILLASPSKIGIVLDSSRGYFAPKMRLLQTRLTGKNRTILYRDTIDQRDHFARSLGSRLGQVSFWTLPLQVETYLFTNPAFVQSTQMSLRLFNDNLPLLYARMAQLKGETAEAIQQYVAFRFATNAIMRDKKTPIVPALQRELDIYATYFLGLSNLDLGNKDQAEFFFRQTLKSTPEPSRSSNSYCEMFRWGAKTNLGLIEAARGDTASATRYLSEFYPTLQWQGNLWMARELVWNDPLSTVAPQLPPAPSRNLSPATAMVK